MRCLLVPAAVLFLAAPVPGAETPPDPSQADDVQDVLYFAENRPLLLRLHLTVDGRPCAAPWADFMGRLFAFLDRDGDGFLDKDEVGRVLRPQQLQLILDGNFYQPPPAQPTPLEELDADRDGKVTPAEFQAYYRRGNLGPVGLAAPLNQGPAGDVLSDTLFNALDRDRDGQLSREEVAAEPSVLQPYDQDDDEMLTAAELMPNPLPVGVRRAMVAVPPVGPSPVMLVAKEEGSRRVVQRLRFAKEIIGRYDKDRDQKLSRDEVALPADLFEGLDRNQDGKLDAIELLRWLIALPDAEAAVHLERAPGKTRQGPAVESVPAAQGSLRRTADNALSLAIDDTQVNIVRPPSIVARNMAAGARAYYGNLFAMLDAERRGRLTRKQIESPMGVALRFVLEWADRDENDKLSREELDGFVDLLAAAEGARLGMAFTSGGRGLFQIFDADGDGRLGARELRTAWARLVPCDRDGDGKVSRREIPRQFHLAVNLGAPNFTYGQPAGAFPRPAVAVSPRGPLWFRKMDRNGDGDLSPREFLGPPAEFGRLDLDRDGLIGLEEAERADALLRRPAGK